jgi:uncharacterized protein
MSMLQTPDRGPAEAFYGTLFGWETEEFEEGITLWRLPGYVGGEPAQPVARDVVAAMTAGDEPGWSVDFWIDDADTAAEKAAELGGRTLMPPLDTPGFRRAVLADPEGAAFSVSQLKLGA